MCCLGKGNEYIHARCNSFVINVLLISSDIRWFTKKSMDGAVYMRYRNLKIGSGPGNDVQLNQIGRCANVSENHAVIFYDDVRLSTSLNNNIFYRLNIIASSSF